MGKKEKDKLKENGLFYSKLNNDGKKRSRSLCYTFCDELFDSMKKHDDRFSKKDLKMFLNSYEDTDLYKLYRIVQKNEFNLHKFYKHIYEVSDANGDKNDNVKKYMKENYSLSEVITTIIKYVYSILNVEAKDPPGNKKIRKALVQQASIYVQLVDGDVGYKKSDWSEIVDFLCWMSIIIHI